MNPVAQAFVEIRADLAKLASDVSTGIKDALSGGIDAGGGGGLWSRLSSGLSDALSKGFSSVKRLPGQIGSGLVNAVKGVPGLLGRGLQSAFSGSVSLLSRGLQTAMSSAVSVFRTGMAAATAVVGAGLAQAIGGGISRSIALENANKMLSNMGLNAEQSAQAMGALNQAVTGTSYSLDQGANSMTRMIGAGTGLNELPGMMTMIADAAAFGQVPMQQVADTFADIQRNGKASLGDLRALADANLPVFGLLAEQLGVSGDELQKMATEGKISSEDFFNAWQEGAEGFGELGIQIAGAAQGMGDTTSGAFANMRASLSRFGAEALRPLMELAKPVFDAIRVGVTAATAAIKPFIDTVIGSSGFQKVKEFFISLTPAILDVAEGVDYAAGVWRDASGAILGYSDEEDSAFRSAKLQQFIDWFKEMKSIIAPLTAGFVAFGAKGLGGVLGPLAPLVKGINPLLVAFVTLVATTPELREAFMSIARAIMPLVEMIGNSLTDVLQQLVPMLVEVGTIISGVLMQVIPILVGVLQNLLSALLPLLPPLGELIVALVSALAPILPVIVEALAAVAEVLLAALVPVIGILIEALMTLMPAITLLIESFAELITNLLPILIPIIEFLAEVIATVLMIAIQALVPILEVLITVLATIVAWLTNIGENITGPLNAAWNFLKAAVKAVGDFISTTVSAIVSWFQALPGRIVSAFGDGFAWLREKATQVKDWISARVTDIVTFITGLPGRISTAFGDGFAWLREKATGVKDWISEKVDEVVGFFTGLPGRLVTAAGDLFDFVRTSFINAINWVIEKWNGLEFTTPSVGFGPFKTPSITIGVPKIPTIALATGGVIDQPTFAMLGEYSGVRSNPEVAAPQSIIRETLTEALRAAGRGGQVGGPLVHMENVVIADSTDAEVVAQKMNTAMSLRMVG